MQPHWKGNARSGAAGGAFRSEIGARPTAAPRAAPFAQRRFPPPPSDRPPSHSPPGAGKLGGRSKTGFRRGEAIGQTQGSGKRRRPQKKAVFFLVGLFRRRMAPGVLTSCAVCSAPPCAPFFSHGLAKLGRVWPLGALGARGGRRDRLSPRVQTQVIRRDCGSAFANCEAKRNNSPKRHARRRRRRRRRRAAALGAGQALRRAGSSFSTRLGFRPGMPMSFRPTPERPHFHPFVFFP